MSSNVFSNRFNSFLLLLLLCSAVNLLVMNDVLTLMNVEETQNLSTIQDIQTKEVAEHLPPLHLRVLSEIYATFGFQLFGLRLAGVIIFGLGLLGWHYFARKIFGLRTTVMALIVLASTWLVLPMVKFATGDSWLFAFLLLAFVFLILQVKQQQWRWRLGYFGALLGGVLVDPISTLLFGGVLSIYLLLLHPKGKRLLFWGDLLAWVLLIGTTYLLGAFEWNTAEQSFFRFGDNNLSHYTMSHLLLLLPWIGFLPAALWDLVQKIRKKEELAIIFLGFLLAGFISQTLIFQMALILLIAKQVERYFVPNYPYGNLVKTFSVLQIIFAFFALMALMLSSFMAFRDLGYRGTVSVSALYWIFSIIAVIGLFAQDRRLVIGGMSLAGAFSLLVFWLQLSPLLEDQRNLSQRISWELEEKRRGKETIILSKYLEENLQMQVYLRGQHLPFQAFQRSQTEQGLYLLNQEDRKHFPSDIPVDTISGRNSLERAKIDTLYWIDRR